MGNGVANTGNASDPLPPMVHRCSARPFRFNPLAGPDPLRIYLLTANSFRVKKFDDPDGDASGSKGNQNNVVAELVTHRIYSVARIFSSGWMLVVCWLIGWLAAEMRAVEIQYAAYAIGGLASLTFGAVMVFDFLQTLRLPRVVVSVHSNGEIVFFDGQQTLHDYQSLSLRTRWSHGSRQVMGNSICTLDLISIERGREHVYQLAATSGAELGPLARRLSTATGIPLEG